MIVVVVGCLWLYLCWDVCDCSCGGMFVVVLVLGCL